jgi:hypothetical protein
MHQVMDWVRVTNLDKDSLAVLIPSSTSSPWVSERDLITLCAQSLLTC